MKKCPKCQNEFADELSYCLEDGTLLVTELAPTVAFNSPPASPAFVVDLRQTDETPTEIKPFPFPRQPNPTPNKPKNYVLPLLIGLLLGGVLVLAAYFIIKGFGEKENPVVVAANTNSKSNASSTLNTAATSTPSENKNNNSETSANKKIDDDDSKYNGRVIAINAYLRSEPDAYATEVDVLPMDERIIIGRRENPNSPWYRVTTEDGTTGWMHGNTIEFTK